MTRHLAGGFAAASLALALTACGGSSDKTSSSPAALSSTVAASSSSTSATTSSAAPSTSSSTAPSTSSAPTSKASASPSKASSAAPSKTASPVAPKTTSKAPTAAPEAAGKTCTSDYYAITVSGGSSCGYANSLSLAAASKFGSSSGSGTVSAWSALNGENIASQCSWNGTGGSCRTPSGSVITIKAKAGSL